jgi:uncharacterized protein YbaR (Trm112 family)
VEELSPLLEKILACPRCRGAVEVRKDQVRCTPCKLVYPVRDGIPVMLEAEATPVGQ